RDEVGQLDHLHRVDGLDHVLGIEIAVAKVKAKFDVRRYCGAQTCEGAGEDFLHAGEGRCGWPAAVPGEHFNTDVPLNGEIFVRDGLANTRDLAEHRLLVGRKNLLTVRLPAKGHDDGPWRWQGDLKSHIRRNLARTFGCEEVLVRRSRFTRVAQLAEVNLFGSSAIRQLQGNLSFADLGE